VTLAYGLEYLSFSAFHLAYLVLNLLIFVLKNFWNISTDLPNDDSQMILQLCWSKYDEPGAKI